MVLSDVLLQVDNFYPKNLKFDDPHYKESVAHGNFLDILYSIVHNQSSKENTKFLKLTESLCSTTSKPFKIITNNQFPAFFCSSLLEQMDKSKTFESHRYFTLGISLLTKAFCIHEFIVNVTFFNNKRFPNKILQIVHTQEEHSHLVGLCFKLMSEFYSEYQFYNHHFLSSNVPEYNPVFDLKNKHSTLYQLLFGSYPNFQYSIPFDNTLNSHL